MRNTTYSLEEAINAKRAGSIFRGRVIRYDEHRGYGFIMKGKREVFFSHENTVSRTNAEKLRTGSIVSFILESDKNGHVYADRVTVISHVNTPKYFELPNGKAIRTDQIIKYGLSNAYYMLLEKNNLSEADMRSHGYSKDDFQYIYIRTKREPEYKIFRTGSPVKGDGQVPDLDTYLKVLDKAFLDIEKKLEKTETVRHQAKVIVKRIFVIDDIPYETGETISVLRIKDKNVKGKVISLEQVKIKEVNQKGIVTVINGEEMLITAGQVI